jgi:HEPN domain-containing protein
MEKFLKQYEIFLKKSEIDLSAAKILFDSFNNSDGELDLEIVLFHLQQCAEKALKAILSKKQVAFSKTHDLELLIQLINENNIGLDVETDELIELGDYAVEGRYSVIHDDLEKTDKYFFAVEDLLRLAKVKIKKK